ncbi:hypothetical protein J22TS3_42380 [Paenibacillus sp. J22TS3]|nr:hypothetical protein J22TS3_42380 [Paenibacillus sp. J22TS3]
MYIYMSGIEMDLWLNKRFFSHSRRCCQGSGVEYKHKIVDANQVIGFVTAEGAACYEQY